MSKTCVLFYPYPDKRIEHVPQIEGSLRYPMYTYGYFHMSDGTPRWCYNIPSEYASRKWDVEPAIEDIPAEYKAYVLLLS